MESSQNNEDYKHLLKYVNELEEKLEKYENPEFDIGELVGVSDESYEDALHTYVGGRSYKWYYTGGKTKEGFHIVEHQCEMGEGYIDEKIEKYRYISKPLFKT